MYVDYTFNNEAYDDNINKGDADADVETAARVRTARGTNSAGLSFILFRYAPHTPLYGSVGTRRRFIPVNDGVNNGWQVSTISLRWRRSTAAAIA